MVKKKDNAIIGLAVLALGGAAVVAAFVLTRAEGEDIAPVCTDGAFSQRLCPDKVNSIITRKCSGGQWVETGAVCPEPPIPGEAENGRLDLLGQTLTVQLDTTRVNRGNANFIKITRMMEWPNMWSMWMDYFDHNSQSVKSDFFESDLEGLRNRFTLFMNGGNINPTQVQNANFQIDMYMLRV